MVWPTIVLLDTAVLYGTAYIKLTAWKKKSFSHQHHQLSNQFHAGFVFHCLKWLLHAPMENMHTSRRHACTVSWKCSQRSCFDERSSVAEPRFPLGFHLCTSSTPSAENTRMLEIIKQAPLSLPPREEKQCNLSKGRTFYFEVCVQVDARLT